jgi:hypothetical protein
MALSEREKALKERDKFQEEQDPNRQWHRPQEHTFEVPVSDPDGSDSKRPVEGGTAAGYAYINTHGEKRLDRTQLLTLVGELDAAAQALA